MAQYRNYTSRAFRGVCFGPRLYLFLLRLARRISIFAYVGCKVAAKLQVLGTVEAGTPDKVENTFTATTSSFRGRETICIC